MGISLGTALAMWAQAPPNCYWAQCQDGEGAGLCISMAST
jgi:hypothetical protein